ncbi:MAG: peptide-methionine (S)-S-oxide reductase MsrA [Candidatus Saccharibacteria bacterium]|nr:peptide-methionine (S)-S-oxide reductase MsrA [Candidatus Saccharibacteria bacterium]
MRSSQVATLAGGCFWCLDAIFRQTKGVKSVQSGFSGGHVENPSYMQTHDEDTGHAEAVQIEFNPDVISYETILRIFWTSHNPTTLNRDGANVGPEYRSEVFYHDETQRKTAENVLRDYAEKLWDDPIVTKITKYKNFYPAEEHHQDYFNKNPQAGYCQVIINPKITKFKEKFKDYLI